jgi:hypothetical protein
LQSLVINHLLIRIYDKWREDETRIEPEQVISLGRRYVHSQKHRFELFASRRSAVGWAGSSSVVAATLIVTALNGICC